MKWEYYVENITVTFSTVKGCKEKVQKLCNEKGIEGWELVNFQYYSSDCNLMLIFKRPYMQEGTKF